MKKIKRWIRDIFSPEDFNNLDTAALGDAMNDPSARTLWLFNVLEELKRINHEVDRRLLSGSDLALTDLCARRKAYQDVLEAILSAKRTVATQDYRHNPRSVESIDLDRVTA